MDAPVATKPTQINRWLPYWAVLQADLNQTLRSWVYRICVLLAVLAAIGYLLYRMGLYREAGIIQPASHLISDLMRWSVIGGVALVVVVTGGCISGERGILADSVLSRGISRYQYFLGKWHARLLAVMGTFLAMGLVALLASYFFLHEDLSLAGSIMALAVVITLLGITATCGVTVSAISNSTVLGIAVLLIAIYGTGFACSLLPSSYPTPDRAINNLPNILQGSFDFLSLGRMLGYSLAGSFGVALVGMGYFSRRDV